MLFAPNLVHVCSEGLETLFQHGVAEIVDEPEPTEDEPMINPVAAAVARVRRRASSAINSGGGLKPSAVSYVSGSARKSLHICLTRVKTTNATHHTK